MTASAEGARARGRLSWIRGVWRCDICWDGVPEATVDPLDEFCPQEPRLPQTLQDDPSAGAKRSRLCSGPAHRAVAPPTGIESMACDMCSLRRLKHLLLLHLRLRRRAHCC